MKKVKKVKKQCMSIFLIFAMLVGLMCPMAVEAATVKRSVTLYVNESLSFTTFEDVKSVKTSNSSVVKAEKDSEREMYTSLLAKSEGKSTVTIQTAGMTVVFHITVKRLDMEAKVETITDECVVFSLKNNTNQTFDKVNLVYSLKNEEHMETRKDNELVYDVMANKKTYISVYVGSSITELLEKSACTAKVNVVAHDPGKAYTDVSDKVKATVSNVTEDDDNIKFNVIIKNKTSESIEGGYVIKIYNKKKKLIGVDRCSIYLSGGETDTYTSQYISKYRYPEYDYFNVEVNSYYTEDAKGW